MAEPGITQTAEVLRREAEQLKDRRRALVAQVKEIDGQLRRLRAARHALGLRLSPVRSERRALNADEVGGRVAILRREAPHLTPEEIAAALTKAVREEGRSLAGLHLRLAQALREEEPLTTTARDVPQRESSSD